MSEGLKFDEGKPRMSLLPFRALTEVARVMGFGAEKYGAHNWRGGFDWSRLSDAALRHLSAWIEGEDTDPETGRSHLSHAVCCLLFLLTHELDGLGSDDRYRRSGEPLGGPEVDYEAADAAAERFLELKCEHPMYEGVFDLGEYDSSDLAAEVLADEDELNPGCFRYPHALGPTDCAHWGSLGLCYSCQGFYAG